MVTSDGPYAEPKKALTGFYLLEPDDLDAAREMASRISADYLLFNEGYSATAGDAAIRSSLRLELAPLGTPPPPPD